MLDRQMQRFEQAGLYLVTSQELSAGRTTQDIVRMAVDAGVTLIQLREKNLSTREYLRLAKEVRAIASHALLIINDRIDIALASGADGVHLGQDDLPVRAARAIAPIPKDRWLHSGLIIGASSHSLDEARAAQSDKATYVNIGPVFPTKTKNWTGEYLGVDAVRRIGSKLRIPFTVMGGIKRDHIPALVAAGARTIAVVTAVTAAPDPVRAARDLLEDIAAARAQADALPPYDPEAGQEAP